MTVKGIYACLAVHLFTIIGVLMVGGEVGDCERTRDFLCGTPLAGFIGQSGGLQPSVNPFSFGAGILKIIGVLAKLSWYDYETFNSSDNDLTLLMYWVIRVGFAAVWIRILWQSRSLLAQAVGRFFTR